MEYRGQGAIEYLLIIGAAILVVAIVILAVTGVLSGGQTGVSGGQQDWNTSQGGLTELQCKSDCTSMANNGCCNAPYGNYCKPAGVAPNLTCVSK